MAPLREWLIRWGTSAAMLVVVLTVALSAPHFLETGNLRNVGTQVPVNLILAAGMTLVILSGGIDLSVGSLHALCGIAAAMVITNPAINAQLGPWTVPAAIAAALGLGALLGFVNGSAIAGIGLPPFIVTLAMMRIARGMAKQWTNGTPVGIVGPDVPGWQAINNHWSALRPLGLGYIADLVPIPFLISLAVVLVLYVMLTRTRLGRRIYAVGSSERAARLSGVSTPRVKLMIYTLMGLLAGVSGVVGAAALQSGSPVQGDGYELNAIAAVVVGGTRLTGGEGSILGTFVGAVFVIGLMNNALNLHNVPPFWQEVSSGAIIFIVALADRLSRRQRQ